MPSGGVAWDLIRVVRVSDGDLRIYQVDKRFPLLRVPVSTIPNFPLFLTLIDEVRAKAL